MPDDICLAREALEALEEHLETMRASNDELMARIDNLLRANADLQEQADNAQSDSNYYADRAEELSALLAETQQLLEQAQGVNVPAGIETP